MELTTDLGNVTVTSTGTIIIADDITTAAGNVDINGAVQLKTNHIDITTANGTVDFSSTIDNKASETNNLTISSGSGAVGLGASTKHIGTTTAIGTLKINELAGTGNITLRGNIGDSSEAGAGATTLGTSSTAVLDFDGTVYNTGAATYTGEAFTLSGADPSFITDGADVEFADGAGSQIVLADASDLTIHTGESGEGDITIAPKILGTEEGTTTTVTLDAGTGDVTLSEEIGTNSDIGNVTLTGTTMTLHNNITTAAGNVDVNGNTVLEADVTVTTANGTVDFSGTIGSKAEEDNDFIISSGTETLLYMMQLVQELMEKLEYSRLTLPVVLEI